MSLIKRFSAKRLCIGFEPDRLTCDVQQGGNVLQRVYQLDIVNHGHDWQVVLHALQGYLQQTEHAGSGLPISLILSSQWCHMMTVPWSDAMLKEGGADRFLRSQYMAVYGDDASGWMITTDDAPYGQPRLACGIERDLWQGLQQLFAECKHQCHAIEPIISRAWSVIANDLGAGVEAFAVIESTRLTLCHVETGQIIAIYSQPCDHAWPDELVRTWQRWVLRLPELEKITQIELLNLTNQTAQIELSDMFKSLEVTCCALGSAYDVVICGRH